MLSSFLDFITVNLHMRFGSTNQSSVSRFSLAVALLAAIAFSSFQTAELSHQHVADDSAENCVLCKTDSSKAVFIGSTNTVFTRLNICSDIALDSSTTVEHFSYQLARAPPQYS